MGGRVTRLPLRYVHRFKDRHGHLRHYFRRAGSRVALPGLPGSAEFMAAYQAALAEAPPPVAANRTAPGSVDALAIAYYRSAEFSVLAEMTRRTYRNVLDGLRQEHGHRPVVGLQPEHVRRLVAAKAEKPAAANALLKMLRILCRFAVAEGWRKDDPTRDVRRVRHKSEGFRAWQESDIAAFEAHHASGSRARLALALLLYTGQRPGDVARMGRQHVRNGRVNIRQAKTGTELSIPVHPELAAALATAPAGHLTFLVTKDGAGFTPKGFGNWFGECAWAAGVAEGCTAHGLRKAAARRLAEAGCTVHEIAAVTGHKSLREVERYTKGAEQARLADGAMARIGRAP